MRHKTIVRYLFLYCISLNSSLACMQGQEESTLQQFFDQRVTSQLAEHFGIPCEELHTHFPPEIHVQVLNDYHRDIPRWQMSYCRNYDCDINDVCLSEKEDKIVFALDHGFVYVGDSNLQTVTSMLCFAARALTSQLYSTPTCDLLLCSSDKGTVILQNIQNDKELVRIQHGQFANAIALDVRNKKIVTCSNDHNACVWNCRAEDDTFSNKPQLLLTLPHNSMVWKTVISNDSTKVATASLDGKARVFDLSDGRLLCKVEHSHPNVCFVHITQDSNQLISAAEDGTINLTDIATNNCVTRLFIEGEILTLFVDSRDKIVAAGTDEGEVAVWDLESSNLLFQKKFRNLIEETLSVNSVSLSDDNSLLAVGLGDSNKASDDCAYLFDITIGKMLYIVEHKEAVSYAILSKSGAFLITTSKDGYMAISKPYNPEQTDLRKLLFLWTLIKKIPSNTHRYAYLKDISNSLSLEYEALRAIWHSFDEKNQEYIWHQCLNILFSREKETMRRHEKNLQII